jgi:hypothetical protein
VFGARWRVLIETPGGRMVCPTRTGDVVAAYQHHTEHHGGDYDRHD